jgi:exodeoxyribonuclease V gamma subunit
VVGCADARGAVAVWADDRPSPLHFQSGDITVCTLVPMRSVPYRVVCLLGMDDQRFPRAGRFDGDDLLAGRAVVGDTDRSSQDRQLLLDAVLAAGDRLIVTYSGRDELTNSPLPPSVPISELRETIEAMTGEGGSVVTVHPLQSFNEINFTRGALGVSGPWAFDARSLEGARAVTRRGEESPVDEPAWPVESPRTVVALDDLIAFLQHPAKHFVRERLMISIPDQGEVTDDTLVTDLDALEKWGVKDRILSGLVAGNTLEAMLERERAADAVPPGELGAGLLEEAGAAADQLWRAACELGFRPREHRRIAGSVSLGERRIEGAVDADRSGARRVSVTPSRLKAPRRLRAFIEMVFLTAIEPDTAWTTLLVGRSDTGTGDIAVTFGPLGTEPAQRQAMAEWVLTRYLELFDRGHRAPLPMPCGTGYAWQRKWEQGRDHAYAAARQAWELADFEPESRDTAYALVFPHLATTEALVLAGFEHHCQQLWAPVLRFMAQERV